MSARARRLLVALLAGVLLAGCSALPESGPVVRETGASPDAGPEQAPFKPAGPGQGDSPTQIVDGFLTAMQANPVTTSVARGFLAGSARAAWNPESSTVVYESVAVESADGAVRVRLNAASRMDSRGGWLGPLAGADRVLTLEVRREEGEWRIVNPPDALIVPTTFFESRYRPYELYFYDRTERVLVPDRVYIPRGEQVVSSLVRGLLAGPGRDLAPVSRTAFPPQTALDFSVLLSEDGTVEVPLSESMLTLPPGRLTRAVAQLQRTLQQVPSLARLRISVADEPLALPDGRVEIPMTETGEISTEPPDTSHVLHALRQGRLVTVDDGEVEATAGPFGRPGFSLRSVGVSLTGTSAATVAENGGTVYLGPVRFGDESVVRTIYEGTDVLKPSFDLHGMVWLVDRTRRGARVSVVDAVTRRSTVVTVPGISGQVVRAFLVSRDGGRLIAVVGDRLVVAPLVRSTDGTFSRAGAARVVGDPIPGAESLVGLTWRGLDDLIAVAPLSRRSSQATLLTLDGSPGDPSEVLPDLLSGVVLGVAGDPLERARPLVVTPAGGLLQLQVTGLWEAITPASGLTAATFPG